MKMVPRSYQSEAVQSVYDYYEAGNIGNPLIALPTGTGKSLVNTLLILDMYKRYGQQRILCLTHVKELIEQNYKAMIRNWPAAPAGIYSASVGRKDVGFPITFAGIGSIYKKAMVFKRTDIIIVDEAHLISPQSDTMYGKFIAALKKYNPHLIVIGMTATPYRVGQGRLTDKGLFSDICLNKTTLHEFNWFIDEGYLAPLIPLKTKAELDIDGLRMSSGEYNIKQMQKRYNVDGVTRAALEESIINATDRKHWLIFATGVEHCENIARMMNEVYGISCVAVHSKIGKADREEALRNFTTGKIKAVVNNNVLTTGFDFSGIDLIIVLRPTASPGLWVQMLGRGTRPVWPEKDGSNWTLWPEGAVESGRYNLDTAEGRLLCIKEGPKRECLVLDFAANTERLGPVNDPVIPKPPVKSKVKRDAPIRICDNCGMYNHASVRACKACGYQFPVNVKIKSNASDADLIKKVEFDIRVLEVTGNVEYDLHEKRNRPTSIRISYYCGVTPFHVWLCFDHPEPAAHNARKFWREHSNCEPDAAPRTVADAWERLDELKRPQYLRVRVDTKYPQVMDYDFDGSKFGGDATGL